MYKKADNIFIEHSDHYIMMMQFKDLWYAVYIDKDDYYKVSQRHWRASHKKRKIYVVSGSKAKGNTVYLHNYLMNYDYLPGYEVDHIDGNSLNNRKSNLRIVPRQANIDNTRVRCDNKIGIRGVSFSSKEKRYIVDFVYHKVRFYFHHWKDINSAVYCRKYAEEHFGIETLNKNPLAQQYLTLSDDEAEKIREHVEYIIKYRESDGVKDLVKTSSWSEGRRHELSERDWMHVTDEVV